MKLSRISSKNELFDIKCLKFPFTRQHPVYYRCCSYFTAILHSTMRFLDTIMSYLVAVISSGFSSHCNDRGYAPRKYTEEVQHCPSEENMGPKHICTVTTSGLLFEAPNSTACYQTCFKQSPKRHVKCSIIYGNARTLNENHSLLENSRKASHAHHNSHRMAHHQQPAVLRN